MRPVVELIAYLESEIHLIRESLPKDYGDSPYWNNRAGKAERLEYYRKELTGQLPDAYAVIDHEGNINYTTMTNRDSQSIEWAKMMCHQHIKDVIEAAIDEDVPLISRWVVLPLKIGENTDE